LPAADGILRLLENGGWHDIREVIDNSGLHEREAEILLDFLFEYNFVELDKKRQRIRLTPSLCNFVKKTELVEEKEAIKE
jgi:DNA-binding IclR family transcriptional regulator